MSGVAGKTEQYLRAVLGELEEEELRQEAIARQRFLRGEWDAFDRHIREVVDEHLAQQQLWDELPVPDKPKRKPRELTYPEPEFTEYLRAAIARVCDPGPDDDYRPLQVGMVARDIGPRGADGKPGRSGLTVNTLIGHMKRYGYQQSGETPLHALRRLAVEWYPGWTAD